MIEEIGDRRTSPAFIEGVKGGKGSRLMGFGHRVYKSYDPRAQDREERSPTRCSRSWAWTRISRSRSSSSASRSTDDYFVSRKLYPNVDFYTGLIYRSMAFPTDFFTVLFAVARTPGWLAQWEEMLERQGAEDRASAADLHRLRRASVLEQAHDALSEGEVSDSRRSTKKSRPKSGRLFFMSFYFFLTVRAGFVGAPASLRIVAYSAGVTG